MRTLGIDPGWSGAAVLLDGDQPTWVASWLQRDRQRKERGRVRRWHVWEVHVWGHGTEEVVDDCAVCINSRDPDGPHPGDGCAHPECVWGSHWERGRTLPRKRDLWDGDDCAPSWEAAIQTVEEYRPWPPDLVVLEAIIPHRKTSAETLIGLGYSRGYLRRALCPLGVEVLGPTSGEWRRDMLDVPEREGAKACAEEAMRQVGLRMPGLLEGCPEAHRDHVSDAILMALWGARQARRRGRG